MTIQQKLLHLRYMSHREPPDWGTGYAIPRDERDDGNGAAAAIIALLISLPIDALIGYALWSIVK